jgi:hypothetical protein
MRCPAPSSPTASQFTASLLKLFICLIIVPCSTLGPGAIERSLPNGGALDHRRMARALSARRGPRAVGQRRPSQVARSCVIRPPVKSTDRPGVAPRKSRDGKGRAQSPHPACGRFEAAHCAAHLATISASCCPPVVDSRFFAGFRKATDSRELDRLNALTKPTTPMRSYYLATVEADARPESGSVHPALVRPPLPLRVWLTAPASAAR